MNTRAVPTLVLALLLTACASVESTFSEVGQQVTASPSSSPAAAPSQSPDATPPADCVNPPPDVTTLAEQTDPLSCYGNADLIVDAQAIAAIASCPGELQPAWLGCGGGLVELKPLPGTSRLPEFLLAVRSQGASVYAVIHPDASTPRDFANTLVRVTGHYDDPAAQDCVITSWPDANPPSPEEVVHTCRSTFVITEMEPLKP